MILLLKEIFTTNWSLAPQSIRFLLTKLDKIISKEIELGKPKAASFTEIDMQDFPARMHSVNGAKVLELSLVGPMTKYSGFCTYGTQLIAEFMKATEMSDNRPDAFLLRIDSPGGSTASVSSLSEAIKNAKVPTVAYVDGECLSAAYFVASFAQEIVAQDKMCEIGSIGVVATILDDSEAMQKEGIKVIRIYPDESNWKNRDYEDALKGDFNLMKDETLKPWAIHFQNTVKENRKRKLDETVEGLLNGRVLYAESAKTAGLIDSIGSFEFALQRAAKLSKINQFFKT